MTNIDEKVLYGMVKKALTELLSGQGAAAPSWKTTDPSGIMSVRTAQVKPEPFDTGKAGDRVFLKDISDLSESPRLGFGVMEMDRSVFKWTLNYDEVDYIIDGTLEILIDGRKVVGHAGDVIFIPAHSTIEFSAPGQVRFFYVVYPANWYEQ
ncbi:MAG: cupin domain-containing protein [Deltaproteobacteria bacterium]|jgi:ethanolamine utilization protein EutQ|nr:cupin domain-containing protein [Deltaproteobacteria bacterium]